MSATPPRITTRVEPEIRDLLSEAATISGISSINAFVLNAAIEKAKKIIKNNQQFKLSKRDALALVEALDAEPKANPRLQRAAKRYNDHGQ